MNAIRVAAAQFETIPGEVRQNIQTAREYLSIAAGSGVRLVVMPEHAIVGYGYDAKVLNAIENLTPQSSELKELFDFALSLHIVLAVGLDFYAEHRRWNAMRIQDLDGKMFEYRKMYHFGPDAFYFGSGSRPIIANIGDLRVGLGICADMLYRNLWEHYIDKVDAIVISSAWPDLDKAYLNVMAQKRVPLPLKKIRHQVTDWAVQLPLLIAKYTGVPVVYANQAGRVHMKLAGDALEFHFAWAGRSSICKPDGVKKTGLTPTLLSDTITLSDKRNPQRDLLFPSDLQGEWFQTTAFILQEYSRLLGCRLTDGWH